MASSCGRVPRGRLRVGEYRVGEYRVGEYRAVYTIDEKRLLLEVVRIRHRREVYER